MPLSLMLMVVTVVVVVVSLLDAVFLSFAHVFLFCFRVFVQVHDDEGRQQDYVGDPFRRPAGK